MHILLCPLYKKANHKRPFMAEKTDHLGYKKPHDINYFNLQNWGEIFWEEGTTPSPMISFQHPNICLTRIYTEL